MDAQHDTDNLAEVLLTELRKTTPNAFLGFPSPEELERLRNSSQAANILLTERVEREREARFQELKRRALANLRKAHP